jgi:hypothetical protein
MQRDVPLAILARAATDQPQIFELPLAVFDLLGSLDDWVPLAPFGQSEDARTLIGDLANTGLIEIRRCESAS